MNAPQENLQINAWRNFTAGEWQEKVMVREFIQANYTPYLGDDTFLAGPTERTTQLWTELSALLKEERKRGVLEVSTSIGSSITAHGPGYINKDLETIVGLQTDAPLRRAIMPNGGLKMVENGLKAYHFEMNPQIKDIFTKYRKDHNMAVFDAYTPEIMACRSSGVITGLPDSYGRGRIIGDYRRVALYGVDFLIADKKREKTEIDNVPFTEAIIRLREELSEQIKALSELKQMAKNYGFDIGRPAGTAQEAVQWLYFGYLAAVKEQNGAAMSIGRISTFLDVYFERDLAEGTINESQAQELIDHLVMKLRIVRFLRTPEYDDLFSGDPTWVTESIGGTSEDGRTLVSKT
ncbi:MAG: pyruvate formate lyase family protein, partial [Deefgea sp.]